MQLSYEKLNALRGQYGDAFYLLDTEQFRKNFTDLKDAFQKIYPNFNIAYSYKTNYTPALCKIVKELGGYAEVVSDMEMELAQRVGMENKRIIWNGPVKNQTILEPFLLNGGTVNLDNGTEFAFVKSVVEAHPETKFNLGIRCNFDVKDGVISRFGFDAEGDEFLAVINYLKEMPNVNFINLQCHFAKRQIDYWPDRAKGMVELIDRIGYVPPRVDIGGGLFGNMAESLKAQLGSHIPSYDEYARAAASVFAEHFMGDEKPELIIEPGSALIGDCMKFVATVKNIKEVRGKYIATALGSQKNISMSGVKPPMEVFSSGKKQENYKDINIVGFTCIEGDVLYKGYNGKLGSGDMVVFGNCGSYSLVMKPPFILPNFAVLDIGGDTVRVIKRAETFNDLFHTFAF